jgi:hypothetical protein
MLITQHLFMHLPVLAAGKIEFGVINQSSSAFNHILNDVSLVVYQVRDATQWWSDVSMCLCAKLSVCCHAHCVHRLGPPQVRVFGHACLCRLRGKS